VSLAAEGPRWPWWRLASSRFGW